MENITFSLSDISWAIAFCCAIFVFCDWIKKLRKPKVDLEKQVESNRQHLENDNNRINSIEESNRILCRSMLAMINHELSGNDIKNLTAVRDDLQQYLIDK